MKKGLLALAFGTFGLGVTEFVMMGILPYLAADFHVSIVEAGHLISAYALGVCVGAPLIAVFARKLPLKKILYILMGISTVAALGLATCPVPADGGSRWQFYLMFLWRFLAGTPHGAFFGTAAIVSDRMTKGENAVFAVAITNSGMTVANLIGNPFCTWITAAFSWRYIFLFTTFWNILTWICIIRWIPRMDALPDKGLKDEFRFLKSPAPWIIFLCTALGNAGVFCWYSYISPTMTDLAGFPEAMMTLIMVLAGAGMVVGNLTGGRLSDKYGPAHTGRGIEIAICLTLIMIAFTTHLKWCAIPLMMFCTACLFAVSSPQQILLLRFSKGGELMGGAMVQIGFNLGNAIGAWAGGLPIYEAVPSTYHFPAAVGAAFAAAGIVCYFILCRRYEPRRG